MSKDSFMYKSMKLKELANKIRLIEKKKIKPRKCSKFLLPYFFRLNWII